MPRASYIENKICPYHINARCINRDWFRLPMDDIWTIFSDQLFFIANCLDAEIFSFVLMSNHFHLLLRTPNGNLPQIMNHFMKETSRYITWQSGRVNQTFGGPYHRTLITNERHFRIAYKYVYRNPVEAKICNYVEDYSYSTLSGLLGLRKMSIPLVEDHILFDDVTQALNWLNQSTTSDNHESVKLALKKHTFKLSKAVGTGHLHELETQEY